MLALIVAYDKNRLIGNKGKIPWKIKGEQERFKFLTISNIVIMGRKTYEEIGKPLPNRINIVVSTTTSYDGCYKANSLKEAIDIANKINKDSCRNDHIFICGGYKLYKEAIDIVDTMYITEIDGEFEGDTYFPEFDQSKFECVFSDWKISGNYKYYKKTYERL